LGVSRSFNKVVNVATSEKLVNSAYDEQQVCAYVVQPFFHARPVSSGKITTL